jgi:homoserine O-acetyltransferase/O-succinyltransferase
MPVRHRRAPWSSGLFDHLKGIEGSMARGETTAQSTVLAAQMAAGSARDGVAQRRGPFSLHHGDAVQDLHIAYRLVGAPGAPIVAALGGISASRFVAGPGEEGWWRELAGPGRGIDTDLYRVLGIDYLAGSGESSGPGREGKFPPVSSRDQAAALALVLDELGVPRLHAIAGASYGGMVALAFAEDFADRVDRIVVLSAAERTHPMSTAWRCVQRRIVREALERGEGAQGLKLARALAMATYRSSKEFAARFGGEPVRTADGFRFPVEDYLFSRGENYAGRYQPVSFLRLSESIDLHHVDGRNIATPTTLIAIKEDQLVPIADMQRLRGRLRGPCRWEEVESIYGHDAFLKEGALLNPLVTRALAEISS